MENFAQDRLAICISGNELPLPNPMTPFVQEGASSTDLGEIPPSLPLPYPFFTLSKILKATNNFDDALVVGTGGFGKVYKAIIDDGTVVAIKRLNTESNQGAEEFWTEVKLLSTLRHTHLVSFIGYCNEHQEMILVYEYMAHGTLASHLYKSSRDESGGSVSPLTWVQRLNICLGAARGLDYLHIGTKQSIIHRDVKTTNILLDENWVAKVSDFGICKLITSQTTTHVSTKVKATRGYWDPDYFYTNRVTRKSDVYAFGVVLLEVLCGRPPLDHRLEEDQISLVRWAKDHIKNGKLDRIIDPSLNGETTKQSLKYFSKIANKCLHTKPKERPTMSEVVELLQNALALHERKGRSWGTITKAFQGIKLVPMGMTRRWREGNGNGSNDGGGLPKQSVPQPIFDDVAHSVDPRFSLAEIHAATNNFNESLMNEYSNIDVFTYKEMRLAIEHSDEVYEDGGVVYKGVIDESVRPGYKTINVTIEKLRPEWVFQGEKVLLVDELDKKLKEEGVYSKLKAEVSYLGQLSHPNLVKLIGYCCEDEDLLLVYEYMASGSLEKHLFKRDCFTLTWPIRMKIALDTARALAFLHRAKRPIIYRDFKTSCILLDADFNAKLSYFGLAVDRPMGPWALMGSYGYAAPEYIATGQLTTRSDVYGFGVVLLEMLVGRKAMDMSRPSPEQNLVEWARPFLIHDEKLLRILDPRVEGQYSTRTALKVAHLAYQCLSETRKERPVMNQVVKILETL